MAGSNGSNVRLGWFMSAAGFKGKYDLQGIAQPAAVGTAIRFMYNWSPMILCSVMYVIFAQGALWKAQGVFSEKAFRTPVQTVEVKPAGQKEKPSR